MLHIRGVTTGNRTSDDGDLIDVFLDVKGDIQMRKVLASHNLLMKLSSQLARLSILKLCT